MDTTDAFFVEKIKELFRQSWTEWVGGGGGGGAVTRNLTVHLTTWGEAGSAIVHRGNYYKITKIVRALWLAKRSVCMRVCKHGGGVKMFCFLRANHASTNLKKYSSSKLHKFTLFTHSFVGWNLENRYKESVSIFFRSSWHFKRKKSVFWKASFCHTRTDYTCKTSWTRLCNW